MVAVEACLRRRALLAHAATLSCLLPIGVPPARVGASEPASTQLVTDATFGYRLSLPQSWEAKPKPLRTHLHEVLYAAPGAGGLKVGLTVDPVKIQSLEQFGTPEQVAERIVAVEQSRDGVKTVALRQVSSERGPPSFYTVEYLTESSRGTTVFRCKYCVTPRGLYVLQAQAKADAFDHSDGAVRRTIGGIVSSFEVLE
ncbi:hypothetical protein AB1Y20_019024 [Prymnesium parvum]|uniref:PsbP C-terminal domain-containing protein n=1 Tax=Prymnesium parvum TaxID=97485 RepID=A0AB34JQ87_PRYPA